MSSSASAFTRTKEATFSTLHFYHCWFSFGIDRRHQIPSSNAKEQLRFSKMRNIHFQHWESLESIRKFGVATFEFWENDHVRLWETYDWCCLLSSADFYMKLLIHSFKFTTTIRSRLRSKSRFIIGTAWCAFYYLLFTLRTGARTVLSIDVLKMQSKSMWHGKSFLFLLFCRLIFLHCKSSISLRH